MVKVRNCKYYISILTRFRIVSVGMIFHPTKLTSVICSFQNIISNLYPIFRVTRFVLGFDRHFLSSIVIIKLALYQMAHHQQKCKISSIVRNYTHKYLLSL